MVSGFFSRVFAPFNRSLQALGEVGVESSHTIGDVFGRTVTGTRRIGRTVTGRLNQGIGELVGKRRGGGRKASRKARSRKNRH